MSSTRSSWSTMEAPTGRPEVMHKLLAEYPHLRSVRLRRNAGKAAAMSIGFDLAEGRHPGHHGCRRSGRAARHPRTGGQAGRRVRSGHRSPCHPAGPVPEAAHLPALQRHHLMGERCARSRFQQRPEGASPRSGRDRSTSTESSIGTYRCWPHGPVSRSPRWRSSTTPDCTARPSTGSLGSGGDCSICAPSNSSPPTTAGPSTSSAVPGSCRRWSERVC